MTSIDISNLFLSAMRQAGFEPECKIVADGKLHRFRDWLDKPGTLNGWYVLFKDLPSGAFGCRQRGISERWSGLNKKCILVAQQLVPTENSSLQKVG